MDKERTKCRKGSNLMIRQNQPWNVDCLPPQCVLIGDAVVFSPFVLPQPQGTVVFIPPRVRIIYLVV